MRALKVLAMCGALAAIAAGIWLQQGTEDTPPDQSIGVLPAPAPLPDVPTQSLEPAETADHASLVSPTEPHPQAARTPALTPQAMARFHEMAGGAFVDYLMQRGLSHADSERVVTQSFQEGMVCSLEAIRAEAEARSMSFDALLHALEATVSSSDGPDLSGLIDIDALQARGTQCMLNAVQQAGIPLALLEQVSREVMRNRSNFALQ